jgi:WD40 repeat protein
MRGPNARTGKARHTLTGHIDEVAAIAIALDGSWLATGGGYGGGEVRIWDPDSGQTRHTPSPATPPGWPVRAVAPDGSRLATAGHDGTVRILEVDGRRCAAALRTGHALGHIVTCGSLDQRRR